MAVDQAQGEVGAGSFVSQRRIAPGIQEIRALAKVARVLDPGGDRVRRIGAAAAEDRPPERIKCGFGSLVGEN